MLKKTRPTELEYEIPDVSCLATKTPLTAVENKMPNFSSFVKKTNYETKITELKKKLTDQLNTLAANVFNARLARANLITKTDFDA